MKCSNRHCNKELPPSERPNKKYMLEGDLVMVRLQTDYGYTNTWWRVMFIDNDESFIGKMERRHWFEYKEHKIGDTQKFELNQIQHIYKKGEQFCYSDKITICDCGGLCKNK